MAFPVYIKAGKTRLSIAKEIREVNRLRIGYEKGMQRKLQSLFLKTARQAAKAYEVGGNIEAATSDLEAELGAVFRATYTSVIDKFASRVTENRKAESQFQSLIFQYYAREGASKVRSVAATTRRGILRAIQLGETEGLGVDKTAKLIVDRTGGTIGRSRAATIARTETHAAASFATDEATRELGLPAQKKRWVSVGDARTRPSHAAANGQEVGIDEPFIIRDKGVEIEMKYPHDGSGGASNNINCRCLAVYFTDEDDLFDDEGGTVSTTPVASTPSTPTPTAPVAPAIPTAPVEPPSPFVTIPVSNQFTRPNKGRVSNDNFPVISKKDAKDRIDKIVLEASKDERYNSKGRFRTHAGSSLKDFAGKNTNFDKLTDDATAMVAVVTDELNYLADFFNVPRLRGYHVDPPRMKAIASQGDGIMNLNSVYFNRYAENMRNPVDPVKANADYDAAKIKYDAAAEEFSNNRSQMGRLDRRIASGDADKEALELSILELARRNRRLSEILREERKILNTNRKLTMSNWEVGSDVEKPYTAEKYSVNGIDHLRSTMYHEFGHHIHQYLGAVVSESGFIIDVPTEARLKAFFMKNFKFRKKRSELFSTQYMEQDPDEFFAESFSLWAMGLDDKVRPEFVQFLKVLADDKSIQ